MKHAGHTIGPWTHENDCILLDPITQKDVVGARIYGNSGYKVAEVFFAELEDVQLILAAPKLNTERAELLKALKGLFEHCTMIHTHWGEGDNTKQADAAIASARALISRIEGA